MIQSLHVCEEQTFTVYLKMFPGGTRVFLNLLIVFLG